MARERCHNCWKLDRNCICGRDEDERQLAEDYLTCSKFDVVHPQQEENALRWIRLCAVRDTGDPSAYDDDPWGKPWAAAMGKVRDTG